MKQNLKETLSLLKRLSIAYKWGTNLECNEIIKEVESYLGTTLEKNGSLSDRMKSEEITKKITIKPKKKK